MPQNFRIFRALQCLAHLIAMKHCNAPKTLKLWGMRCTQTLKCPKILKFLKLCKLCRLEGHRSRNFRIFGFFRALQCSAYLRATKFQNFSGIAVICCIPLPTIQTRRTHEYGSLGGGVSIHIYIYTHIYVYVVASLVSQMWSETWGSAGAVVITTEGNHPEYTHIMSPKLGRRSDAHQPIRKTPSWRCQGDTKKLEICESTLPPSKQPDSYELQSVFLVHR